ncbi:MAG: hypothetical protein A2018_02610 [Alphaproteobacteria bacterium GWF2_58_20]|nr:MAG: hypothetical protein A2018_02610 [Alphaproteobacteria bacterium GWF2_58_20]
MSLKQLLLPVILLSILAGHEAAATEHRYLMRKRIRETSSPSSSSSPETPSDPSYSSNLSFTSTPLTNIAVGTTYSYTATAGSPFPEETLSISAITLPAWLSFTDNGNRTSTLSGTPTTAGAYPVTLKTTDEDSQSVLQNFTITATQAVNPPPTVAIPLEDRQATASYAWDFTIPSSTFSDTGDSLTYTATLDDGGILPEWLSFTPETRRFSGIPLSGDIGVQTIKITATDSIGQSVSSSFMLTINTATAAPALASAIPEQGATIERDYSYTVLATTFNGAVTNYAATLADGSDLPEWLSFNPETRTFSGHPTKEDLGAWSVRVRAYDAKGQYADATFAMEADYFPSDDGRREYMNTCATTGTQIYGCLRSTCNAAYPRGFIRWNTTGWPEQVSKTYARFTHPATGSTCYSGCSSNHYIFPITSSWSEATLCASAPSYGPYILGPYYITVNIPLRIRDYDITNSYRGWRQTGQDYGIAFWSTTSACANASPMFVIYSREHPIVSQRPRLVIIENYPPSFTSTAITEATPGGVYSYDIAATDEDGDPLTITVPIKRRWLELTSTGDGTATLSGIVPDETGTSYDITLEVSDGRGGTATQSFTITTP